MPLSRASTRGRYSRIEGVTGSSWRYQCKRKRADVRNMLEMVGCSRLPGSHGLVAWKRVTTWTRRKHTVQLIQHMHSDHGRSSRCYTFEACIQDGSSS